MDQFKKDIVQIIDDVVDKQKKLTEQMLLVQEFVHKANDAKGKFSLLI